MAAGKRFSGLSGYKRALDSRVDALVLEDIPYFYREQAAAAIDAGCHVYMAKPYRRRRARRVRHAGPGARRPPQKKLCFRVDYQLPMDPANQEVKKRIGEDALGGLAHIYSGGTCGQLPDPPVGPTIENLFQRAWYSHIALSGDLLLLYDIHIIDGVTWATGQRAAAASGYSRIVRPDPHGDRTDCGGVVFQLADGTCGPTTPSFCKTTRSCTTWPPTSWARRPRPTWPTTARCSCAAAPSTTRATCPSGIYADGAKANIAAFYRDVTAGQVRQRHGAPLRRLPPDGYPRPRGHAAKDMADHGRTDQGRPDAGSQSARLKA